MALTWEELRPVVFTIADIYVLKNDFRYEFWELVNEIWVSGRLQKLSNIRLAYKAATYALLDFFRKENNRLMNNRNRANKTRKRIQEKPLVEIKSYEHKKICSYGDCGLIDSQDEVNFALHDLSLDEKLIIEMRLMGFTCRQIGRKLGGVSGPCISQRCHKLYSKIVNSK